MIALLDNYDSFTWNLAHLLAQGDEEVCVWRCDKVTVAEIMAKEPRRIVISPGPGRPGDRGIALDLITSAAGRIPLLGVCLGHQAMAVAYGGRIIQANTLVHGKTSPIHHDGRGLFRGLPDPIDVMRYHSLVVDRHGLPSELEVSATLEDGTIMGLRHKTLPLQGIQFHPESFLTPDGSRLVRSFLEEREN